MVAKIRKKHKSSKNIINNKIVKKLKKAKSVKHAKSIKKIPKLAIKTKKTSISSKSKLKSAKKITPKIKVKLKSSNASTIKPVKRKLSIHQKNKLKKSKTFIATDIENIQIQTKLPIVDIEETIDHISLENNNLIENTYSATESLDSNDLYDQNNFQPYHIDSSEEYMNEQQLQHFANILNNWKQELMEEVDHTITEMKEADVFADPNDRATQEETFNLELRTRDRERKLIKKIEAALNKIDEQQYGYCESCGVEIGIRRLEARPTATLCIECKTLAEMKEKRY